MQQNILTIVVEDYFHVAALRGAILRKHWDRLDPRLERNVDELLEMLARFGMKATFFVYGRIAELQPELIKRIVGGGHEIASRGFWPRTLDEITPESLVGELRMTEQALEMAGANRIIGYRSPQWLRPQDLWTLDVLAEQGYAYDSSINPVLRRFASQRDMFTIHKHRHPKQPLSLWEFPISTVNLFGFRVAITGGNYIRQLPHTVLSRVVAHRVENDIRPQVFYLMPWELDRGQPQIQGVPPLQRIRHYRRLGKTRWVLEEYFERYQFVGIAEYLGIDLQPPRTYQVETVPEVALSPEVATGEPISVVVPMFNEETNITYLRRTLLQLRRRLDGKYRTHFVLVDDCSTDDTYEKLKAEFADVADCQVIHHDVNQGVAAGIMTGIRAATTEIVCSLDCDGSYDPLILERMVSLMDDADMVTASPYHPQGEVVNVPPWRLFLSKSLSRMYSTILRSRIHTYTSCCRVYRRSAMIGRELRHGGFLGVAEMLIELKRAGGRIVEYPATLESRLLGESKMKIGRTIVGHLGLIQQLMPPSLRGAASRALHQRGAEA